MRCVTPGGIPFERAPLADGPGRCWLPSALSTRHNHGLLGTTIRVLTQGTHSGTHSTVAGSVQNGALQREVSKRHESRRGLRAHGDQLWAELPRWVCTAASAARLCTCARVRPCLYVSAHAPVAPRCCTRSYTHARGMWHGAWALTVRACTVRAGWLQVGVGARRECRRHSAARAHGRPVRHWRRPHKHLSTGLQIWSLPPTRLPRPPAMLSTV